MNNIELTSSAVAHFQKILQEQKDAVGVRLGIKSTGCSGLSYVLDIAKDIRVQDKIFETEGISVIVDPNSLPFLQGTVIDWVIDGLNEYLQFKNPNVKGACGCGESFTVEN